MIKCPKCSSPITHVMSTRSQLDSKRRYRTCFKCRHRFITVETIAPTTAEAKTAWKKKDKFNSLLAKVVKLIEEGVHEQL